MKLGAITLMLAEAILGKVGAEVTHDSVACDFCDYTGRSDSKTKAIAVDNGGLRKRKGNYRQTVNQHMIGHAAERGDGGAHRFVRGAQNIDAVNLNGIDNANRPAQVRIRDQGVINFFA